MPHGNCYLWTPGLVWLHVISDALIVCSYYSIPLTLIYFVHRRKEMRFGWMFVCFAVFIVACGTTHLLEIWNVWHGNYWLTGLVKAVTALASVPTAFLLTRLVAPALKLPSTADLQRLNLALEQEVATRSRAEEAVRRFNLELEKRVEERNVELHSVNAERESLLGSERAARTQAEQISKMKDEFLSNLSHELRTPLNAIYGWAQILLAGPAEPDDLENGLVAIERNSRVQRQIIDDLLDMSEIISGKVRMNVQRTDLTPIVRAAVDTIRPAAMAKTIRLRMTLDPSASPVSGDPGRLQQIFWNLLSNAIKFTPQDGRIEVLLERVNSHLEVRVVDSGEGISAEFLPHVFDRFEQEDNSIGRRYGGLGLGLSITKHLVELHGGTICAQSGGPNRGATFVVVLPLLGVLPARVAFERPTPNLGRSGAPSFPVRDLDLSLSGVKVLVVDDEVDSRVLVQRVLERCGAVVRTAASAAEALSAIEAEKPDVLVSDIGMPGENGYELIRQVRSRGGQEGGIPAVALTAYASSEDRLKAVRAGFQMHMAKPVEAAELLTIVSSLASAGA